MWGDVSIADPMLSRKELINAPLVGVRGKPISKAGISLKGHSLELLAGIVKSWVQVLVIQKIRFVLGLMHHKLVEAQGSLIGVEVWRRQCQLNCHSRHLRRGSQLRGPLPIAVVLLLSEMFIKNYIISNVDTLCTIINKLLRMDK
ncbi:hypothetical protein TNCV_2505111 [Trichonephila clavipes]|uniref:Uncharacterized protein n=1 Tax=Trichonephila clavipes TaxID=2585209 RepID=A0A8X6WFQ9_TRICX|nr:hypothetical protein TNCV_2505111 [Trichonephila clavipes]